MRCSTTFIIYIHIIDMKAIRRVHRGMRLHCLRSWGVRDIPGRRRRAPGQVRCRACCCRCCCCCCCCRRCLHDIVSRMGVFKRNSECKPRASTATSSSHIKCAHCKISKSFSMLDIAKASFDVLLSFFWLCTLLRVK